MSPFFVFQVFQWVLCHLWSPSYQRRSKRTLTRLLTFLWSQIFKQLLRCFHFVMPNGQTTYNILYFHHQIFCNIILSLMLYHSYVRKAIRIKILQHHSGPFGSSLSHSSSIFKGAKPSLSGLTCCPRLFRMLGFDRSYTSLLFLAK